MDIACREQTISKQTEKYKKLATIGLTEAFMAFAAVLLKAYMDGNFDSVDTFQKYVTGFGLIAPLFLVAFQAIQVIQIGRAHV